MSDTANILDCRGLSCPEPVVRSKKHISASNPESMSVIVDNQAAMENVSRLLRNQGYQVETEKRGADWRVSGSRNGAAMPMEEGADDCDCATEKVCVVISSSVFGSGDDELGSKLMKNFLATLPEFGPSLWLVILLNGGVKLAAKGSHVLDQLKALQDEGTGILVCGACLEHFKLMQDKMIGETTNMMDVVTSMQFADKVIKI
ncbi:sulfurtransferase-like selenium metabolism protein YedF [Desulfovibrio sp. OttesenSCG-928-C06]|nr:sulfurtransferase-like selenium metabolism protein YedF [Desulfovibrio sp. OttesenSCG-928-C06]